ncbi:nucleolar protein 58 [Eucalyptus grandis]|uniref:nucleolar protein 58 n=1 Tax=Eucalyptus grandis TaxID=71139 RepID=UPI00192EE178|nr:nucleolar protein 58 [Eucalyptus grandis]
MHVSVGWPFHSNQFSWSCPSTRLAPIPLHCITLYLERDMGEKAEDKSERKDEQPKEDKHKDGEHAKEEKKEDKTKDKKKKDKECKKEKNPEDKNDPQKLRQKLEKVDAKMQALAAKREEILKSIQEAEQKAKASGGEAPPATTSSRACQG